MNNLFYKSLFIIGLTAIIPFVLIALERQSIRVEVIVPPITRLRTENSKPFPEIDTADFNRGYIELKDAVTLSVSSNVPWKLVIFTKAVNFYDTAGKFKSIDHFHWSVNRKSFQPLSSKPAVVMAGKMTRNYIIKLDYRIELSWHDTPPGRWKLWPEFRIESQ
jgi:hypothetical protein